MNQKVKNQLSLNLIFYLHFKYCIYNYNETIIENKYTQKAKAIIKFLQNFSNFLSLFRIS